MKHRSLWLSGLILFLSSFNLHAADEQPRYDVSRYSLIAEIKPVDNKMEAFADIRLKVLDKTNFITLRLNGNLSVTSIEDETGEQLRYIQDDTEKFEVMINLVRPVEPGTEKTLHLEFNGIFPKSDFDFLKELGNRFYSYIGPDMVELYASSFWYPQSINPLDRAAYELQLTLPAGLQPLTAGRLVDTVAAGLSKTYIFRSDRELLPLSVVAGRYLTRELEVEGIRLRLWFFSELPAPDETLKQLAEVVKFLRLRMDLPVIDPLTVVEVSDKCRESLGMEGVVFLTSKELAAKNPEPRTTVRKLAYQRWLYPLNLAAPEEIWIAEGLAQYTAALFTLETRGEEAFDGMMRLLAVEALKYLDVDTIHRGVSLGIGSEKYNSVVVAKSAWVFHMLRNLIGTDNFEKLLKAITVQSRTKPLDTAGLGVLVRQVSGSDYEWFFNEWIDTVDLPEFTVEYIVYRLAKGGFQTVGKINQNVAVFQIPLEIKMLTKGQDETKVVDIKGESSRLDLNTETRPIRLVLDPNFRILRKSAELEIQVHLVKAEELYENDDFLGAIDEYKKAIEKEPRNSLALYKLGLVFYEQFNYNSAQNTFRDALNGNQKPAWVVAMCYLYMGKVFDVLGQRQRAVAEYNKSINTGDDSHGAIAEAQKYLAQPFTRKKTFLTGKEGSPAAAPGEPPADAAKPEPDASNQPSSATPAQPGPNPAEKPVQPGPDSPEKPEPDPVDKPVTPPPTTPGGMS